MFGSLMRRKRAGVRSAQVAGARPARQTRAAQKPSSRVRLTLGDAAQFHERQVRPPVVVSQFEREPVAGLSRDERSRLRAR